MKQSHYKQHLQNSFKQKHHSFCKTESSLLIILQQSQSNAGDLKCVMYVTVNDTQVFKESQAVNNSQQHSEIKLFTDERTVIIYTTDCSVMLT